MKPGLCMPKQALIAAGLALFLIGNADAKTVGVYKCAQVDQPPLYTDQPCPGAERLEVDPGKINPAAEAMLARDQEALDRAMDAFRLRRARELQPMAEDPDNGGNVAEDDLAVPADGYYVDGLGFERDMRRHTPRKHRSHNARRHEVSTSALRHTVPVRPPRHPAPIAPPLAPHR